MKIGPLLGEVRSLGSGYFLYFVFSPLSRFLLSICGWAIPAIFLLRALGDFRYVGFFKKVKTTPFAKADTKFFSPLCLMLGLFGIAIQLLAA